MRAPSATESRASTGSVDGTVTGMFASGGVSGTFHAVYYANGNEL
jgi:hypothetical protein